MQRSQRADVGLLLFCVVPVLLALFLFTYYQHSGAFPVPLPVFAPPVLPDIQSLLPANLPGLVATVKDHFVLVSIGAAISICAFLTLTGIWCDLVYRRPKAEDTEGDTETDDLDAPWVPREG